MVESNQMKSTCIETLQLTDWVNRLVSMQVKEVIETKKWIEDEICLNFTLRDDGLRQEMWKAVGNEKVSGTVCVDFEKGQSGSLDLFINQTFIKTLLPGQTFCTVVKRIHSIELACRQSEKGGKCTGKVIINAHFDIDLHHLTKGPIECYFSDKEGSRVLTIICEELTNPTERRSVEVKIKGGNIVLLQEVDVLIEGYVTVLFKDPKNKKKKRSTFHFSTVETFFLCAPDGTSIQCEALRADCRAYAIPSRKKASCVEIIFILDICLSVEAVKKVFLELKGDELTPRKDEQTVETCLENS